LHASQKGYGFIQPDIGGKDVFVHISAVEKAGMDGLPDGAKITYDIISDRGKESAGNLLLKRGRRIWVRAGRLMCPSRSVVAYENAFYLAGL
jgi:CspA family cold shock protein